MREKHGVIRLTNQKDGHNKFYELSVVEIERGNGEKGWKIITRWGKIMPGWETYLRYGQTQWRIVNSESQADADIRETIYKRIKHGYVVFGTPTLIL